MKQRWRLGLEDAYSLFAAALVSSNVVLLIEGGPAWASSLLLSVALWAYGNARFRGGVRYEQEVARLEAWHHAHPAGDEKGAR